MAKLYQVRCPECNNKMDVHCDGKTNTPACTALCPFGGVLQFPFVYHSKNFKKT